jgi:hypothetical protein
MKKLSIAKPCTEKWEDMEPTLEGAFCQTCTKNVVDFTKMDAFELAKALKSISGSTCGRLLKSQLQVPLDFPSTHNSFKWPKPYLAGTGLLMAATLLAPGTVEAAPLHFPFATAPFDSNHQTDLDTEATLQEDLPNEEFKTFRGKATYNETNKPVVHARVIFFTLDTAFSTFTDAQGVFALPIPSYLIQEENLFKLSFLERQLDNPDDFLIEMDDITLIIPKEDLEQPVELQTASKYMLITGHVNVDETKSNPLVMEGRKQIDYQDFIKGLRNDPSGHDMKGKDFYYFDAREASALLGRAVNQGVYLVCRVREIK